MKETLIEYMIQKEKENKAVKVFKFFMKTEDVNSEILNGFIKDNNLSKDEFDNIVYDLLSSFCCYGKWNSEKNPTVDEDQLMKGILVEYEHTDNPLFAERIALDHLSEISDYYDRLEKMEYEAKDSE